MWLSLGVTTGVLIVVAAVIAAMVIAFGGDDAATRLSEGPPGISREGAQTLVADIETEVAPTSGSDAAENNDTWSLPGIHYTPQGRGHADYAYDPGRTPRPFCPGVRWSGAPNGQRPTPIPSPLPGDDSIRGTFIDFKDDCYNSNPPSSGTHLNVQRNVDVGNGNLINIPPDPGVYPPDVEIPREAIPHFLEHAGVFVGYNCDLKEDACADFVAELEDIVNDRIDNHDDRVVLAFDSDLVPGTVALASWTRVEGRRFGDLRYERVANFIEAHACRFDPEGFCR